MFDDDQADVPGRAEPAVAATETTDEAAEDFDFDALVKRLRRNAMGSLIGLAVIAALVWQEVMAVVGLVLGGGLVLANFLFLESLVGRILGSGNRAPSRLQTAVLLFRTVLLALLLYGIFVLPGVRPIPVALGLSIMVLAVLIEALSQVFTATPPRA